MSETVDRALQRRSPPPRPENSPSVSPSVLSDANTEDLRYLQEIALELGYADFAKRGVTIQNFLRMRQLAFQDVFEDISEELKRELLTRDGDLDPESVRAQPEYLEIRDRFRELAVKFAEPEADREWLVRVAKRNRRNLERLARTDDRLLMKDAGRAAAEILEREMPKASRTQLNLGPQLHITPEAASLLARAFAEAKLPAPEIPVVESVEITEEEEP